MVKKRVTFLLSLLILSCIPLKAVERIISLAPSLTKNIYLLQAENKLIGCTSYCSMAVSDKKEIIGSAISVNIEKTIALRPDLIIATTITNPETIETFKKVGIRVVLFTNPVSFDEICDQLISIGEVIDRKNRAQELIQTERIRIDSIRNKVPDDVAPTIFFQIGAKPIFTVLKNTFMNDFIIYSGGKNVCNDFVRGTVSRETILVRNPDVILVSDMGLIGYEEKKSWEKFNELNAVKHNKVIVVDSDKSCSPTVTDFRETLEFIVHSIY